MALTDFAFLVFGPDYHPSTHTHILQSDLLTTRVIGVDFLETAEIVAKGLVSDGVQLDRALWMVWSKRSSLDYRSSWK